MPRHIQIIEDDEAIRDVIEFILQQSDYEVSVASNAKEFKINLFNNLPDLILMDVRLPDGNGLQLCRKLKQSIETKNIPVIIMSANATLQESKEVAIADGFIAKPFDLDYLMKMIAHYFN